LEVCESLALPRNQPEKRYMTMDRCQAGRQVFLAALERGSEAALFLTTQADGYFENIQP